MTSEPSKSKTKSKTKATPDNEAEAGRTSATGEVEFEEPEPDRAEVVRKIIRRNVYWALGLGAIPFPFVDAAGVAFAQIKMIRELSAAYGVEFSESRTKGLVTSLISSLGGMVLSYSFIASVVKVVPVVGYALSIFTMPVVSGALTMTMGNVFMMHFESGGTLLDFDPEKMREHFKAEFEKNKLIVEELRNEQAGDAAKA
ncbi:MAG: DUF697 domain-containing protein [Myxococcales bacterium]|nr:DUF697 domain-containing protein [Myxococcales bacterium]